LQYLFASGDLMNQLVSCMFLLLIVAPCFAQEVGYLDLTGMHIRESTWPRHGGGGMCGTVDHAGPTLQELTTTLSFIETTRFRIGEEITFEIKVQNTGKRTLTIPWTPHLADLEPGHVPRSHIYLTGAVALTFTDAEGREEQLHEIVYGDRSVAGTLRRLRPGEWFSVKMRKKITVDNAEWGGPQFRENGFVNAIATGAFLEDIARYSPQAGGSVMDRCVGTKSKRGNALEVSVEKP
jgi:hypothetical protein